jgi:hypothetical protein
MGKMKEAVKEAKEETVDNESQRLREDMKGFTDSFKKEE